MPTTRCSRGDVMLVRFVFADEQGAKRRPVLVLSTDGYHSGRTEVIVAAMTSNVARVLPGDHLLDDWAQAGLPKPSVATGILRTVKRAMLETRMGTVSARDLAAVEGSLRRALGL